MLVISIFEIKKIFLFWAYGLLYSVSKYDFKSKIRVWNEIMI